MGERSYLLKIDGKVVERPQHLLMRVAVGIHGEDFPAAIETYNLLSEKWFTHASPTLFIAGTNGTSNGLVPMLRVYNNTARYVDQGGNKRPGAFAMYLEPWHADVFEFLDLRKNTGKDEQRARDLFYALWIPDLFMKRVEENGEWCLMCPHDSPGLADCWGEKFEELYTKYEKEGRYKKKIKAQQVWYAIIESQVETGTPYMLYKDACNG